MPISFPSRSGQSPQRALMFQTWSERFPKLDAGLMEAIKFASSEYATFCDYHERVSADQVSTPGARLVKSAKAAKSKVLPAVEKVIAASTVTSERIGLLSEVINNAVNPAGKSYETVLRHQEIRAYLRSIPVAQRSALMQERHKENDEDFLIAVSSVQGFLSGVQPQLRDWARNTLIERYVPREAAAVKELQEQQELAAKFVETMLQSTADVVDMKKADELQAAATQELV